MKKLSKILSIMLFGLLFTPNDSNAQGLNLIDHNSTTWPTHFVACGQADTLFIRVQNNNLTDTFKNIVLTITPSAAFEFIGATGPEIISTNIATKQVTIRNLFQTGNAEDTIKLLMRSKCGAKNIASVTNDYSFSYTINASPTIVTANFLAGPPASPGSYTPTNLSNTLSEGVLQMQITNNSNIPNSSIGDNFTRRYKFTNTGTATAVGNSRIDTIQFRLNYESGLQYTQLRYKGNTIAPTTVNGQTVTYTLYDTLEGPFSATNDSLIVFEDFTVTNCLTSTQPTFDTAWYGCYGSRCNEVRLQPDVITQLGTFSFSFNNLYHHGTNNDCFFNGNLRVDTVVQRVINTGTETAYNFAVSHYNYHGVPYASQEQLYLDTAASFYQRSNISSPALRPKYTNVELRGSPTSNPCGLGRINTWRLTIDSLAPGDTVYYTVIAKNCNISTCGNKANTQLGANYFYYNNRCNDPQSYYLNSILFSPLSANVTVSGSKEFISPTATATSPSLAIVSLFSTFDYGSSSVPITDWQNSGVTKRAHFELPKGLTIDTNYLKTNVGDLGIQSITYNSGTNSYDINYNKFKCLAGANCNIRSYYTQADSFPLRLVVDCSAPGVKNGIQYVYYNSFFTIPGCLEVELHCTDSLVVNIICPLPGICGGSIGGISLNGFQAYRTNWGMPDSLNNGTANGVNVDSTKYKLNKYTHYDAMRMVFNAKVNTGISGSFRGVDFNIDGISVENEGGASILNSHYIGTSSYTAGYTKGQILIYRGATSYYANFDGTTNAQQLPYKITNTGGYNRNFVFNVDSVLLTNLAAAQKNIPAGFQFEDLDSIVFLVDMRYYANGSITSRYIAINSDPSVMLLQATTSSHRTATDTIAGCSYLIDIATFYPYALDGHQRGNPWTNCETKENTFDYEFLLGIRAGINATGKWPFSNEYRKLFTMDSVYVYLRNGWVLDSAQLRRRIGDGNGSYVIDGPYFLPPVSFVSTSGLYDVYKLDYSKLWKAKGGNVQQDDDALYHAVSLFMRPTCAAELNTAANPAYRFFGDVPGEDSLNLYAGLYVIVPFEYKPVKPEIVAIGSPYSNGINKQVTNDFRLDNKTTAILSAANGRLVIDDNNGAITVDSIEVLSTGVNLARAGDFFTIPADVAAKSSSTDFRIFSRYTCSADTLRVLYTQACQISALPLNFEDYSCGFLDTLDFFITPLSPSIQTQKYQEPGYTFNLCDTGRFTFAITNVQSAAALKNNFQLRFPAGLSLLADSSYVSMADTNFANRRYTKPYLINSPLLGSNTYYFNIDSLIQKIDTNGLRPTIEAPNNAYYVSFVAKVECGYISGTPFRTVANAVSPCGKQIPPSYNNNKVLITGAIPQGSVPYIPTIGEDTVIRRCDSISTKKLKMVNFATGVPTTIGDKFVLDLPLGISYQTGSSTFSTNAPATAEPTSTIIGSINRLSWDVTPGINRLDSMVWTVNIKSDYSATCGAYPISVAVIREITQSCGGVTCNLGSSYGADNKTYELVAPSLQEAVPTTLRIVQDTSRVNGNLNPKPDSLFLTMQIVNNGKDTSKNAIMSLYLDNNDDNTFNVGDVIFATVNDGKFNNMLVGQSITLDTIITRADMTVGDCNVKLLIQDPCDCNQTINSIPSCNFAALPVNIVSLTATNINNTIGKVMWLTASEYNALRFDVYRSIDGFDFIKVGAVAAKGNSQTTMDYFYNDNISNLPSGKIYYKLKQIDNNGTSVWTNTVDIAKASIAGNVSVMPNPAADVVEITLNKVSEGNYAAIVYDMTGKLVLTTKVIVTEMSSTATLDVSSLPVGVYTLRVNEQSIKLLIKR